MTLPTLDMQSWDAQAFTDACRRWGFFQLIGHDIDSELTHAALSQSQRFFSLATQVKNQIARTPENMWGFNDAELTKNKRDWKEVFDVGPPASLPGITHSVPQWPDLPGFQETMEQLTGQMHQIGLQLVERIGESLDSPQNLIEGFQDHSSFLRLNYYPLCEEPAEAQEDLVPSQGELGISHHTDAGAVTVLLQDDQPGLQVRHNDRWHTVSSRSGALIINLGDIVQVWSNDAYRAPVHRVLANAAHTRYSAAYFLNPGYDYNYEPLLSLENNTASPVYTPINWGEFRGLRTAGDYADYGQEVQISDFKLANRQQ